MQRFLDSFHSIVLLFALSCGAVLAGAGYMKSGSSIPHVSSNGVITNRLPGGDVKGQSENGIFTCRYEIGHVSDEVRELNNFELYGNGNLLYTLPQAPGSDVYISNNGIAAFMDMKTFFKNELTVHFYSSNGQALFSEKFNGASLFGFSPTGNKFAVGTAKQFYVISLPEHRIDSYPTCDQFDISQNEKIIALAERGTVRVYQNGALFQEFKTGFMYPRRIKIAPEGDLLAVIDKRHLKIFDLREGGLATEEELHGKNSYRDLRFANGNIVAGIQHRETRFSKGIARIYDRSGNILEESAATVKKFEHGAWEKETRKSPLNYDEIPWPFFPYDSMRTVWNHYEQHMGGYGSTYSYLHQGLDLITPIAEPVYAVQSGAVKCVLTIGGAIYWRMAISPMESPGYSDGWLYAHLIESTIQFDVGDTVQVHDYLGDIIEWTSTWGHIHFVQIRDSGLVWQYFDNEWGINFNPLLALRPNIDSIPPVIENVFPNSKFAFCTNETSNYLDGDSLYGDIDIIIKVKDYVNDSPWEQPAYKTFYWVNRLPGGENVFPRTLGQALNHTYDFYEGDHFEPYATIIYKRDQYLQPSSWMDEHRDYHHILTNNNGDSLIDLGEKDSAFVTTNYPDGDYRIYAEAQDEYGNSTIDSMDVKFRNGIVGISDEENPVAVQFDLEQNYPNPFNSSTRIYYSVGKPGVISLKVYDVLGREVRVLASGFKKSGNYSAHWDAKDYPSGIYIYRLQTAGFTEARKMLLVE